MSKYVQYKKTCPYSNLDSEKLIHVFESVKVSDSLDGT